MKRRALLLYSSLSGNTEKVAEEFRSVLTEYGFECVSVLVNAHTDWETERERTYFDDFDLICVGSPIIAGTVFSVLNDCLALKPWRGRGRGPKPDAGPGDLTFRRAGVPVPGIINPSWKKAKGIVFTTYGGSFIGPDEAIPVLNILKMNLQLRNVDVIGQFSCYGSETKHNANVAAGEIPALKNSEFGETMYALQLFEKNPNDPYFDQFTAEEREIIAKAVRDNENFDFDTMTADEKQPGSVFWHYDSHPRPDKRDLTKAHIFIQDVVEDYFLTADGQPRPTGSVYLSIS